MFPRHQQYVQILHILNLSVIQNFQKYFQVFCDNRSINIEQFGHCLLCRPNGFVFIQYLYAVFLTFNYKCKELCRAVAYLEILCHDSGD